jgi:hypothetical protein
MHHTLSPFLFASIAGLLPLICDFANRFSDVVSKALLRSNQEIGTFEGSANRRMKHQWLKYKQQDR